jgi:hypothetical protein
MSEHQHRGRAELIRDEPVFWLVMLYAVSFLACSIATDLWDLATGDATKEHFRYLFSLMLALPTWRYMKSWANRVLSSQSVIADL